MKRNPAIFLLIFVYLWIVPACLSYQNSWVHPEELYIKNFLLKTGVNLNFKDIKNGLFWQLFEYKPRCTRPLASYFEIIDTKFRCRLWHYIMPHPSLSLTWIFSLVLAPLFLYRLLRNLDISLNLATALTAFYLATPGVLSVEAMLFRPAKPMADFFIIFCLYLASRLKKGFLDKDKPVPVIKFLAFWAVTAFSFYWDETALLIFPAALFIFPSIFRRKSFLFLWLLLPLITLAAYLEIIPYLCVLAGHDRPHLLQYDLIQSIHQSSTVRHSFEHLGRNAGNLILETMGLFPFSGTAPKLIIISMALAVISWIIIFSGATAALFLDPMLIFLVFLLFLFNTMMSVVAIIWGPYYYGSFWSVFFVLFLSKHIEKSKIPKLILCICFFFIIISTANTFTGVNIVTKKYHWYPYSPGTIEDYFQGTRLFFDKRERPVFSDKEIRTAVYQYWVQVRNGKNMQSLSLPRELGWLPIELEPEKSYDKALPGAVVKSTFQKEFTGGAEIFDWLVEKGYLEKYPSGDCFIKEDMDTTITNGLKEKYPDQWKKILAVLQESETRAPHYYTYKISLNNTLDDAFTYSAAIEKINPEFAEDLKVYSMDLEIDPRLAEAYNDRANIYFELGNFTKAISDYNKAIRLKPGFADTYYNLGFIYYKQGNLTQAVLDYTKAIELNPKDTGAYNDRAVIYYKLKEYNKAREDVNKIEKSGAAVNPQLLNALKHLL